MLNNFINEFTASYTSIFFLTYGLIFLLTFIIRRQGIKRLRVGLFWLGLHLIFLPFNYLIHLHFKHLYPLFLLMTQFFGCIALVLGLSHLVFDSLLLKLKLEIPRILEDLFVAFATLTIFFVVASQSGYNVTGLIATSAVLTGVLGLAMQDTLGNVIGGVILQLDQSIQVGDWIKVGNTNGRVNEVRWRYTAVESRNWETIIIPNSQLMKGNVTVLGKRENHPVQWRRWIWFNVDFRHSPAEVIQVVSHRLLKAYAGNPNIAAEPKINCLFMSYEESYARYAVRYWLTNLQDDDPTDSQVRIWLYMALKRANMKFSMPAQKVYLKEVSQETTNEKYEKEIEKRKKVIREVDLFQSLGEEVIDDLAEHLIEAPFLEGEVISKQGAEGLWLYLIVEGQVSVQVTSSGISKVINHMGVGDYFGEQALLTGEKRNSTILAVTKVKCYRLGKFHFIKLLQKYPKIAESIAQTLSRRELEINETKEQLNLEYVSTQKRDVVKNRILKQIQKLFD